MSRDTSKNSSSSPPIELQHLIASPPPSSPTSLPSIDTSSSSSSPRQRLPGWAPFAILAGAVGLAIMATSRTMGRKGISRAAMESRVFAQLTAVSTLFLIGGLAANRNNALFQSKPNLNSIRTTGPTPQRATHRNVVNMPREDEVFMFD